MTSPFYSGQDLPADIPFGGINQDLFEVFQPLPLDNVPPDVIVKIAPLEHGAAKGPFNPFAVPARFGTLVNPENSFDGVNRPDPVSVYHRFEFTRSEIPSNNPLLGISVNIEEVRFRWQVHARFAMASLGPPGVIERVLVFDRKQPPADGGRQTTFAFFTENLFPRDPNLSLSETPTSAFNFVSPQTGWAYRFSSGSGAVEDLQEDPIPWEGSGGETRYVNSTHLRHKPGDVNVWQGGSFFKRNTTERYWSEGINPPNSNPNLDVFEFFTLDGVNPINVDPNDPVTDPPAPDWMRVTEGLVPEMLNGDIAHFGILIKQEALTSPLEILDFVPDEDPLTLFGPVLVSSEMEVDFSVNGQATQTVRSPRVPIGDLGDETEYSSIDNTGTPPPGTTGNQV